MLYMKLEDIPAEVRWEIATKAGQTLSIGYGLAFRQILGNETVQEVENSIWAEGGKQLKTIADSFGLPAEDAIEVDEAFGIVGMILLGKMEYETVEANENTVITRITDCPNLNAHKEMFAPIISMPHICQIYSNSAVETLNPKYTLKYNKKMCDGDEYCEYCIGLK